MSPRIPNSPLIRLPEPYKTKYELRDTSWDEDLLVFQLQPSKDQGDDVQNPPQPLHHDELHFSDLVKENPRTSLSQSDNTTWARACRSSVSYIMWDGNEVPTVGHIWNIVYALVSLYPSEETFRLSFASERSEKLLEQIKATGIAKDVPKFLKPEYKTQQQILVSRAAFWQGAGSPFGTRAVWIAHPSTHNHLRDLVTDFHRIPLDYIVTSNSSSHLVNAQQPSRPGKPPPGSTIYSRYIRHLDEFFSMVHLDYENDIHLRLFNEWQNNPQVAADCNESCTLEQNREYLRRINSDPHRMAVLGRFNDNYFAYFEIYWAKEDHIGAYYPAQDWDRGCHSLVGDERFHGRHRATVWWESLIHYIFLDEPRTTCVIGEPKATNEPAPSCDFLHGIHIDEWVELANRRFATVRCERARFFEAVSFGGTINNENIEPVKARL